MTLINKGKKMLNKKKETMMGKIDREADEYAELQRKGDAIWNSCRSHASYKAYVLGKLKYYKTLEERRELLMQTEELNNLIELLHAQVDFLFQDTEYVVTRYRVVNDEEQDEDYSGRLGGISGLIEINRADDEGEQVACLEVIGVPGDDENFIFFEFDVEHARADIQKFNDAAKATEYLHSMVLLENTPGVEDFECGPDPTFH